MRHLTSTSLVATLIALAGCGDSGTLSDEPPTTQLDGGAPTTDAGAEPSPSDPDAGEPGVDAGEEPGEPDAGVEPEPVPPEPEEVVPTGTPQANEVRLNATERYQQLDGVGTNSYAFPIANDIGWNWSQSASLYDELDLHYVRLASWFEFWEPQQDVYDPSGLIANHDMAFARFLNERGIDVELGVWQVADWMAGGSPRTVNRANYPDLGESIATYLTRLEEQGLDAKITEVQNEPGIEAAIRYMSPEDLRDAALAVLDALDAEGHTDVMLHGPNWHAPNSDALRYAEVWLSNERLRDRTAALSYHTWWHDDFASFDAIRQLAERYNKPVWATEVGYCALPGGCGNGHFLLPETWETSWDLAMSFYRAIDWSRAERLYHWTVTGFDPVVDPATGAKTPSFYVLKHFSNFIEPGSRYVATASGDSEVLSMGFLNPGGDRVLVLLNTSGTEKRIQLSDAQGLSTTPTEALTTSRGANDAPTRIETENGSTYAVLPAQSVTSLRF